MPKTAIGLSLPLRMGKNGFLKPTMIPFHKLSLILKIYY